MDYTVMSYNIERMREIFQRNRIRPECQVRAQAIVDTIRAGAPHILGIVEASDKLADHEHLIGTTALGELGYQVVKSKKKRGKMDLVMYCRPPFEPISIDANVAFYDDWIEDIDQDSIDEVLRFERKPLEVQFRLQGTGKELMVILISLKSKGVFSVADIHQYEHLALANRKRLFGQSKKIRQRLNLLLEEDPCRAIVVMGDLNDELGMDYFQRMVGASAVETITGDIHAPEKILHNALWHLKRKGLQGGLWTNEYPDPIVHNLRKHRAWLDHIFLSPGMRLPDAPIRYIEESGEVAEKDEAALLASDHVPVRCRIQA